MSESLIFFTDRSPSDSDPYSFWVWQQFEERARSGFEVYVYLFGSRTIEIPDDLHQRIHVRTALQGRLFWRWSPFIQSLISTPAESICLIEPLNPSSRHLVPMMAIPQMVTLGLLRSHLHYISFSAKLPKVLALQVWAQASTVICYSHPQFAAQGFSSKARFEPLHLDPKVFAGSSHWSLAEPKHTHVVPGSLNDLMDAQDFLQAATEAITKDTSARFVFVHGLGGASLERKKAFFESPMAAHFIFPEKMTGAEVGQALFNSKSLMLTHVKGTSPLAGLALKIILTNQHGILKGREVYGLL